DYIGDARVDLTVWAKARRAITVGVSDGLRKEVEALDPEAEHLPGPIERSKRLRAHIKAMRPHQWLKNILVFVPAVAAHEPSALGMALAAFVAISLAASSIYIINDLLDLSADRRHPRKCKRPFAAADIPIKDGIVHAGGIMAISLLIGILIGPMFLGVLLAYLCVTTAYSLVLKRKLMIDIWTLSALYTLRIVAGGAATGIPLSEWLLAFSIFLFLSLAAVKRQSELADLEKRGALTTAGRGYNTADRPVVLGVVLAAGYCSVLVLALYVSSDEISSLYGRAEFLWLVCPLLLYWVSRVTIISHRGEMDDDPIVFAIKDRVSLGVFGIAGALIAAGAIL
ncbi:MAG: UbiA family prenyltransferase, partial [Pseudomonadota bacterium]